MTETLAMTYYWVKAGHLIFVIFWMAGLFMLPRYFIYHQECGVGSEEDRKWAEREKRLLKIILLPSIIVVWVLGLVLAMQIGAFSQGWFHVKLLFVLILSGYHGYLASYARRLAAGKRTMSDKQLRIFNEVPGIVAAIVVVLAVIKPF